MTPHIAKKIDGRAIAQKLRNNLAQSVAKIKAETGKTPTLAVVLVGQDPASEVYVRMK